MVTPQAVRETSAKTMTPSTSLISTISTTACNSVVLGTTVSEDSSLFWPIDVNCRALSRLARRTQIRLIYGQSSTIHPLYSYTTLPRDEFLDRIKHPCNIDITNFLPVFIADFRRTPKIADLFAIEETISDLRRV